MRRPPRWSVTWPTRPSGTYTVLVRAADSTDAVRVAAAMDLPLSLGYSTAFDYEPSVWRFRRPYRLRAQHAQGPLFPDAVPGEVAFTPVPLEPAWPKGVLARYETVVGAHVELTGGGDFTYRRCTGCGDGRGMGGWSEHLARERAQAHAEICRALPQPGVS